MQAGLTRIYLSKVTFLVRQLSCVFFCVVWFCLLLHLLSETYSCDIFRVEWFPLHRPDWRVIYCNGLLYVFPTRNIVNFLICFTFLTAMYLSKAWYSLYMPLNWNQSRGKMVASHSVGWGVDWAAWHLPGGPVGPVCWSRSNALPC